MAKSKKSDITARDITKSLFWRYHHKQAEVISNCHLLEFESDFMYVTRAGYMHEVEVKISRSDFRADFKKESYKPDRVTGLNNTFNKHIILPEGLTGLKSFSFAVPKDLITLDEVPEYAGLYYYYRTPNTNRAVLRMVKKAPTLLHPRPITKREIAHIYRSIKYQWLNTWLK